MSARRDILFAVGLCLMFSLLSINARSLEETSVKTKRDTDWWTILEDILYDNDSDSDDADDENVLICQNCTVVVQAAPNATADGSTAAPQAAGAAPGSSPGAPATPPGSTPGAPAPVAPETPAPSAPATSPQPVVTAPPTAAPPTAAPGG
ncbi:predicted GPI-anchored protein 58 [Drosophila simulans]|uniref:predicted GPI-anchored protein 58 n=1 Tax=Drosophila simulans TaxID=7240 RepID=UPI00078AEC24|nr:predicted GPI-anchored protein 58 [Drosophila simulans]KMZ04907.1 uncharacterized protein Dsimw501_GD28561 [Drosophila simulans]